MRKEQAPNWDHAKLSTRSSKTSSLMLAKVSAFLDNLHILPILAIVVAALLMFWTLLDPCLLTVLDRTLGHVPCFTLPV